MLLHLANPNKYEVIISDADKEKILRVFGYALGGDSSGDREEKIKRIKANLFDLYTGPVEMDRKERWFFYMDSIRPLWKPKNSRREQNESSIRQQIHAEENASEPEGDRRASTGYVITRSSKLVKAIKKRDGYTCQACGFHFQKRIVHAHHLDPLSERREQNLTTLEDLITLCPTCHYLAHHLLQGNPERYKQRTFLLNKIKVIRGESSP